MEQTYFIRGLPLHPVAPNVTRVSLAASLNVGDWNADILRTFLAALPPTVKTLNLWHRLDAPRLLHAIERVPETVTRIEVFPNDSISIDGGLAGFIASRFEEAVISGIGNPILDILQRVVRTSKLKDLTLLEYGVASNAPQILRVLGRVVQFLHGLWIGDGIRTGAGENEWHVFVRELTQASRLLRFKYTGDILLAPTLLPPKIQELTFVTIHVPDGYRIPVLPSSLRSYSVTANWGTVNENHTGLFPHIEEMRQLKVLRILGGSIEGLAGLLQLAVTEPNKLEIVEFIENGALQDELVRILTPRTSILKEVLIRGAPGRFTEATRRAIRRSVVTRIRRWHAQDEAFTDAIHSSWFGVFNLLCLQGIARSIHFPEGIVFSDHIHEIAQILGWQLDHLS